MPTIAELKHIISLIYIIPSLLLYFIVLYIIFLSSIKHNFSSSFYWLFGFSAINYIFHSISYFIVYRFTTIVAIRSFLESWPTENFGYFIVYTIMYYTAGANHIYSMVICFNRATKFLLKNKDIEFWKKILKYVLAFCLITPIFFVWTFPFVEIKNKPNGIYIVYIAPTIYNFAPWMSLSRNLFIEISITASISLLLNLFVIYKLIKWRYFSANPAMKISSQELMLIVYSMLVFLTEVLSCIQQFLIAIDRKTFLDFVVSTQYVFSTQYVLADISTLAPVWFILATNDLLRKHVWYLFGRKRNQYMPSLNRDILNPICEKLILDGNQNAIFNFAFSGKESLEAIKWKFSTITHLELYDDCYKIGWEKPSTTFFLNGPKIHSEKLTKFIGGKVQSLHFDTCNPIYFSIIDNIKKSNEFDTLSIGKNCHLDDVVELISFFSESIKHLKISSFYMVKKFKKHLNLDSLILTDIACPNFVFFPVTTPSLIVQSTPLGNKTSWQKFYEMIGFSNIASSFISSVENLTFDDRTMKKSVTYDLMEMRIGQIFIALSSLKILNFEVNFSFGSLPVSEFFDRNIIQEHFGIFDNLAKSTDLQNFPKKIIYFVYNWVEADIDQFKNIFYYFQFDDTKKKYVCLRRKIKSRMPEDTVFEIRFVH